MPVQINSTLMENHVAGHAPVPQKQLAVVYAADQSPVLFAVDDKDRLTVTLRDPGQTTGWAQIPLSDQLAGIDGLGDSPTTQSFAVSQDTDGGLWLALAVSAGDPRLESHLYTSPKLSIDTTPDDWRRFAELLLRRPTPAGVAFSELVLGNGDDGHGFPGIVAGTLIAATGYVEWYVVNPDPSDPDWTCVPFKMPDHTTYTLSVTFGSAPGLGRGIYAMCATTNPALDSLTFTTLPTVDEHGEPHWTVRTFDLPYNYARTTTVALAALPVSKGDTELYLSGAGLHRYPLSLQTASRLGVPIQISDKTFFGTTSQLAVSCDPAATTIDVWAKNGYDQLAHTTGYLNTAAPGPEPQYTWDPALTLATEITALAAYRSPMPDDGPNGAGGVAADGQPTQGAVAIAYIDHLALMTKSSASQLWLESAVSLQTVDVAFDLSTFTTQITVTDDDNIALADTPVLIRPSFDVPALVNGKYYALKAGIPKSAVTDPAGNLTIVLETNDLAPPTYQITIGDAVRETDPAADLVAKLRTITTPDQVYYAQRSDGGALFPDPADPDQLMQQCSAAVTGIEGMLTAYDQLAAEGARAGSVPLTRPRHGHDLASRVGRNSTYIAGCHFAPDGGVTVLKGRAALEALPAPDAWEWIHSIGDALKAAIDGIEQAVSWTVHIGEDIINFVIDLGDRVLAFVLDVLEQALGVLNWILRSLFGFDLNDILAWLGFLFDWGDILDTHRVFSKILDLVYPYAISLSEAARADVHEVLQWCKTSLLPIDEDHSPYQDKARHSQAPTDPGLNSPQANWANRQFETNAPATSYGDGNPPDDGNPFADISERVVADMGKIGEAVAGTFVDGFTSMDWSDALNTFVRQIGELFFDDVEYITDLMFDAVDGSVKGFQAMATGHWDIPVITWLYEHIIDPGGRLSLQDLGCLLAAIPATVAAKAATGENCFDSVTTAAIMDAATWQDMITALADRPAATGDDDADALAAAAKQVMVAGSLRIVGFLCYAASNIPAVKRNYKVYGAFLLVKAIADWIAWANGLGNTETVEEIRPAPETVAVGGPSRQQLDKVVVVLGFLPLVRDLWLCLQIANRESIVIPEQEALAIIEVGYGITQLALASTVVSWELGEPAPPPTEEDDWRTMVNVKFATNLSGALTSCLAFEEALPPGYVQTGLAVVRAATQLSEIGCGIWVGHRGIELKQSDTGIG
ncbi:hypothetical protein ABH935_007313 [Catenulispora sp. GAS73]|uniref:hypothetical protein n=1 Tax=Catenulispora sp. GAS73 TaxID=3156269 RepID=UPI003517CBEA